MPIKYHTLVHKDLIDEEAPADSVEDSRFFMRYNNKNIKINVVDKVSSA